MTIDMGGAHIRGAGARSRHHAGILCQAGWGGTCRGVRQRPFVTAHEDLDKLLITLMKVPGRWALQVRQ